MPQLVGFNCVKYLSENEIQDFTVGDPEFEVTRTLVEADLKTLAECVHSIGGTGIFGGVVRDFLVGKREAGDIDIWFTEEAHVDIFLNNLPSGWTFKENFYGGKTNIVWYSSFNIKRGTLQVADETRNRNYCVDLVVSSSIPCNDSDINRLVYNGVDIKFVPDVWANGQDSQPYIDLIKQKVMTLYSGYLDDNTNNTDNSLGGYTTWKECRLVRVEKFFQQGWTIVNNDKKLKEIKRKYDKLWTFTEIYV